ncbi:PHD finger protein 13-like isoform X2 [Dreissena polymorpha]|uniref:PHD finger protein 13-like isoform X2 n=1 Tax=Dreissena polymorpha TaxID=45954 RepID=UPI002265562D|nr:PHD finger protein 13-like isoform X2 [Dreissena polymorpha]
MTDNIFKAPRSKRMHGRSDFESGMSPPKKGRTKADFYTFCSWVLTYTQYEQWKQDEIRSRDNTSPMDSASSTAESYTSESTLSSSSKDDSSRVLDMPDSDESWEVITCFCLKPYAGRPMIECSECNTWIHLSCAKIRKTNIPETFVCNLCKEKQFKSRKSSRVRFENKRIAV